MNLIVPVNLQALRVTPNDASLITKRGDLFAGPTTSFEGLPWRGADYREHWIRPSRANIAAAVSNPIWGAVTEQLDAGVHLHWALPDGLSQGVQQADGALAFAAVPNRWLVTRIISVAGATTSKQWVVESDRLMMEDEYLNTDYPATKRKAVALPVGWTLVPKTDPKAGGAVYGQPWRRLGRVFELAGWQPKATPADATPDQVLHLDELPAQLSPFSAAGAPVPLRTVGPGGPAFAAYYPDSRGAFGFHDNFSDVSGADLASMAFTASYIVTGWHSHASDDPLQTTAFEAALAKAIAANAAAPAAKQVAQQAVAAGAVQGLYRWVYDPTLGTPARCLYGGQLAGLAWDTTGNKPDGGDPNYPKCYLQPLPGDDTVRLAVGASAPGAMAALIKHEWSQAAKAIAKTGAADGAPAPAIPPGIEDNLEYLIDALQLGLLHEVGGALSLPQLEQALHQSGFGALQSGSAWIVRAKGTAPDKTNPQRFNPPEAELPDVDGALGRALATLNLAQARLDAVLGMIDSCRRQIFVDWNLYIAEWGTPDGGDPATIEVLKDYISAQILDLWAKLDAAFGVQAAAAPATGNLPVFSADASNYLSFDGARYQSAAPAATLTCQIGAAANAILDILTDPAYANFELASVEGALFWQTNEPVVVATGNSLQPAQRNGVARLLPCRLTAQLLTALDAGAAAASLKAADAAAALALSVPSLSGGPPEAQDAAPLMADVAALLGEACLLDASLAPALAPKLGAGATAASLSAALADIASQIASAWAAGPPEQGLSITATLADLSATAGALRITLPGQPPQGLALTAQPDGAWQDPFLPLFLVWEVSFEAYEKGQTAGAARYDANFITSHFALDAESIDLTVSGPSPAMQSGSAPLKGFIPLSSRAAEPLLDQIRQYLQTAASPNPQLQAVIDHLKGKPLLSQGLSGLNPALLSRAQGMQLAVFNPFYYSEAPATALGAATDTFDYANVLTYFVGAVAGALADQVPLGAAGFNPLRSGGLTFVKATVVDVFGRRRTVIDSAVAADADKVVVSAQLQPPQGLGAPIGLPPRLAAPARLRFDWVSGNDGSVVSNSAPSTSPVTGWVVFNYLDNSLMLFAPSGAPLGSLGVFGAQTIVAWQSAPGRLAQPMAADLASPGLAHLLKFATFLFGTSRDVFDALTKAIEEAHTYILPDGSEADLPYAVLMGHPLALVRAELRLEMPGLPAFNTALAAVLGAAANGAGVYDPTLRDNAGLSQVAVPVRLGDRDNLADGLVAYLIDGPDPYATLYAPAAPSGGGPVQPPAPDTLMLTLRPALDPPATAYANAAAQTAALRNAAVRPPGTAVTMLIDPRASVNATTGILPIQELTLASRLYSRALRSIEVSFFTHPILRGASALDLPAPQEPGFTWAWTMGVRSGGRTQPSNEPLLPSAAGDRASFDFTPQEAQDGWLTLVPAPAKGPS